MSKTVSAIVRQGDRTQGVVLREASGVYEVLTSCESSNGSMKGLYDELVMKGFGQASSSLSGQGTGQDDHGRCVAGYDSRSVAFYQLELPAMADEEMGPVVRMQAESLLPLPVEQMALAWRMGKTHEGRCEVTLAAARIEHLEEYVREIAGIGPARISLDCEGVVKAWRELYGGGDEATVVVYIEPSRTQLCLAREGKLVSAISLDMGLSQLSAGEIKHPQTSLGVAPLDTGLSGLTAGEIKHPQTSLGVAPLDTGLSQLSGGEVEHPQTSLGVAPVAAEQLAHDLRGGLEFFGISGSKEMEIHLLSDGRKILEEVVSYLNEGGIAVKAVEPQKKRLRCQDGVEEDRIYELAPSIGLALMGHDRDGGGLDLFAGLYTAARKVERVLRAPSWKLMVSLAVLLAGTTVLVNYLFDVKRHAMYTSGSGFEEQISQAEQKQSVRQTIAARRVDHLGLLSQINGIEQENVQLASYSFKRGQRMSLTGTVKSKDELYKYIEALSKLKGLSNVNHANPVFDAKKKKLKFSITFDYKHYTKRQGGGSRARLEDLL